MLQSPWRQDFPILQQKIAGNALVYLDSAATTQKPQQVIDALTQYYSTSNANVHRGLHILSERATNAYESARQAVASFINAAKSSEVVFVRGATEAINLVASSYAAENLQAGDEILISQASHHANIVPWQWVASATGAKLRVIPISESGAIDIAAYTTMLNGRTKLVAVEHISNVLGAVNDIATITDLAHKSGARVLVDAAQSVAHVPVDVQQIGCDFLVFSGHKAYAPTGIGVLYAHSEILSQMRPYQGGGDMIRTVTMQDSTYNDAPYRFEAGTPNIAGAVGLHAAINYLTSIGWEKLQGYENKLTQLFLSVLQQIPEVKLVANPDIGVFSFSFDSVHPHDMATIFDSNAVCVRAGHHCAMPLMKYYKVPALLRVSLGLYNQESDLDAFVKSLRLVKEVMVL